MKLFLTFLFFIIPTFSFSQTNETSQISNANYATFIMYHRFGEGKYPSTNVSKEQFFSHIDYILSNEIKVIELEELIKDLDQNKKFNDKG